MPIKSRQIHIYTTQMQISSLLQMFSSHHQPCVWTCSVTVSPFIGLNHKVPNNMLTNSLSALKYVPNDWDAALTHAVAALFPKVPQTQHALFTARTVPIGRTTLAQLLQDTHTEKKHASANHIKQNRLIKPKITITDPRHFCYQNIVDNTVWQPDN